MNLKTSNNYRTKNGIDRKKGSSVAKDDRLRERTEGKRGEKRGRPRKKRFNLFRPIIAEGSGGAEQNGFETG